MSADPFSLELYKHLKNESRGYLEKVPGIWLQKFILMGAASAFLIANKATLNTDPLLLSFGIGLVPLISIILDIKTLEFGLHAKLISAFIREHFENRSCVASWERFSWGADMGRGSDRDKKLAVAKFRSNTTLGITVAPTCVVILVSVAAIDQVNGWHPWATSAGVALTILYCIFALYVRSLLWPRQMATSPQRKRLPDEPPL